MGPFLYFGKILQQSNHQMMDIYLFPPRKEKIDIQEMFLLPAEPWYSDRQATSQSASSTQGQSVSMKDHEKNKTIP